MKEQLRAIEQQALAEIQAAENPAALEELRVKYLGKKGGLTAILKQMGKLSAEERPIIGEVANKVRESVTNAIEEKRTALQAQAMQERLLAETVDVTIPGKAPAFGHSHPMTIVMEEVRDIFIGMGFSIAEGPEVEYAVNNFDKLNTPEGHPSMDWQDTFYFKEDSSVMLRSQTSPVQVRVMESQKPPIRIIAPGRVYRKDEVDATHSPMFHQIEGLVVDRGITMADLKGTLDAMVKKLYGAQAQTRFRPHHFPFTEPSCEVDVQCHNCGGIGCRICKGEGWIELLGAGMVHPNVLRGCGIDPEVYSGFAFGMGVERTAMRRFSITDLRLLFENDIRFLSQF